jgi:hypothetical protein
MLPTKFRFIWSSGFRGEDFFKSVNQKQELPMAAMFVNGLGQNEQSLERTFHRCFLPSFTSFGWGVSEEKIKMWKVNGRQTTDAKWWQKLTLPLARWAKKGCTRLAAASDKVYQLLAHGRCFSPDTPASSTTKTGRHDIAEILLKVALNTINEIKANLFTGKNLLC